MEANNLEIPTNIMVRLEQLSEKHGISLTDIIADFSDKFKTEFIQKDPQFKSDVDRYQYTASLVWVKYNAANPTQTVTVIPIGFKNKRFSKKTNEPYTDIFVLEVQEESKFELNKIVCRGSVIADLPTTIELFNIYKIEVEKSKVLFATNKTKFVDPKPIPKDPAKMLIKYAGIPLIKINETPNKLSMEQENGFVDDFDMKMVRGIIINFNRGDSADGSAWGVINISDETAGMEEVTDDGKIIPSSLACWVPPEFILWARESEVIVVGTIDLNNDDIPRMNGVAVIPRHAFPISSVTD